MFKINKYIILKSPAKSPHCLSKHIQSLPILTILILLTCHRFEFVKSQLFQDSGFVYHQSNPWIYSKPVVTEHENNYFHFDPTTYQSPSFHHFEPKASNYEIRSYDEDEDESLDLGNYHHHPSRFDSILKGDDSLDDETWQSDMSPPPLPLSRFRSYRHGRGRGRGRRHGNGRRRHGYNSKAPRSSSWAHPHDDLFDYSFYDQTTYGIPQFLPKTEAKTTSDHPNSVQEIINNLSKQAKLDDGYWQRVHEEDDRWTKNWARGRPDLGYIRQSPEGSPPRMSREESIDEFYSICSYLYPNMQNKFFCTKSPTHVGSLVVDGL